MKTIERIREVAKSKGIKLNYICQQLGLTSRTYFNDVEKNNRDIPPERLNKIANILGVSVDYLLGNTPSPIKKGVRIPVYGSVAAGIPIEAITDIEDYEDISEDMARNGEYIALRIKGHSMEPVINFGDVVIVRLQDTADDNDIAIVVVNGDEATCKRIKKSPEGVALLSANPLYDPMFYTNEQIENLPVRILGKVVELRRTLSF